MRIVTETGSQYEINTDSKQVRKLVGGSGTNRIQGEWKSYINLLPAEGPKVGTQVMIVWGDDVEALEAATEGWTKTTITSRVVEIHP